MTSTLSDSQFTLAPVGDKAKTLFPAWDGNEPGDYRVVVDLPDLQHGNLPRRWTEFHEHTTGHIVEVRAADCGAGCFCSGEVRVPVIEIKVLGSFADALKAEREKKIQRIVDILEHSHDDLKGPAVYGDTEQLRHLADKILG